MEAPLFGLFILDRDPTAFVHFWGLFQSWLSVAGGCAMAGLSLYLLYAILGSGDTSQSNRIRMPVSGLMLSMFVVALLGYAVYFFLVVTDKGQNPQTIRPEGYDQYAFQKVVPPKFTWALQPTVSMFAGLAALVGMGGPFVRDLFKLRARRIFALSKLGFKEAVRSRVFWVFLVALLPFLFPVNWFYEVKPEDELRASVRVTSIFMELLLLLAAGLLTAFSIPNDIKNQNIYTIVSKPVERFEIVLGRFFGYTGLMTIALAAMVAVNLTLIGAVKVDEKAVAETQKARVPHRGTLTFLSRKGQTVGTNVGREFDYRKYIGGSPNTTERACWLFDTVPVSLTSGDKDAIACEFSFDIFRLTKGEENRGVDINIRVTSWQTETAPPTAAGVSRWPWVKLDPKDVTKAELDTKRENEYLAKKKAIEDRLKQGEFGATAPRSLDTSRPGDAGWKFVNELAEEYGFYEYIGKEVYDYHPDGVPVPVGLFRKAREGTPDAGRPRVVVTVQCTSGGQMLGMAEGDLYLLEGTQTFSANYFKAAVGLWCRVALVIGIAVSLSTYLAGVVTLLTAGFLYICAYFSEHIRDVAGQTSTGGGPMESLTRMINNTTPNAPLEKTAVNRTAGGLDTAYAWTFRQFNAVIPDIDMYTWTPYLKEGFNVNTEYLAMNVLVMVGYLIPWMVLSYYLLRNREVAA